MSEQKKRVSSEPVLTKHDRAINEYLESLLLEIDEGVASINSPLQSEKKAVVAEKQPVYEQPSSPSPSPSPPPTVVGLEQLVSEVPDVIAETISDVQTRQQSTAQIATPPDIEMQPDAVEETVVPEWGQKEFQCLLFKVSGLSLAVPLVKLKSVIPWDENITQTPNQTRWYLGLVKHLEYQVKVIDTAMLVMPENRHDKIALDSTERLSHILLVDDYKWGLACDSIGEVIWLKTDDVKWRKNKTSRAWLSGTALEHLCAIMDTEVFAQMLDKT
ncbi:hypothetical protein MNBD_GAMMA11-3074 [hydrothermal vent metagenome]|uniref:CheW-like domain-containing protein n=1 Tax=hydrothermal vent metagenome TaxID=652676 RepID=A0A3B0XE02_9ZZZZ